MSDGTSGGYGKNQPDHLMVINTHFSVPVALRVAPIVYSVTLVLNAKCAWNVKYAFVVNVVGSSHVQVRVRIMMPSDAPMGAVIV